jgi:hypothetical protein
MGGVCVQLTIDRTDRVSVPAAGERDARRTLRAQVARLERELAEIVADSFPHVASAPTGPGGASGGGARLLDLEQLERTRDELAGRVQLARRAVAQRARSEARARALLERMRREPAGYRFVRLPVRELGEHGCGVWEVRPRLGLIGMLAGWWQVKLSSGCPLPRGRAPAWPSGPIPLGPHVWMRPMAFAELQPPMPGTGHDTTMPSPLRPHRSEINGISDRPARPRTPQPARPYRDRP